MVYNVHKNECNDRESRKRNFENVGKIAVSITITMQISQNLLDESKQYLKITLFPT